MNAQQKKNGWFFNKNIIDEINSVPEEEVMFEESVSKKPQPEPATKNQGDEMADLKRAIAEKDDLYERLEKESSFEKQRLTKENDKYKQALLRSGEEKAENRRHIQDLETEVRRNRQEIQHLQENKETSDLQEQLEQSEAKVTSLKATLENYQMIEEDLEKAQQQLDAFTLIQKDEALQHDDIIQKLERQMDGLVTELNEKEDYISQLDQVVNDKDHLIREKEDLVQQMIEEQKHQDSVVESELVSGLQHQITELQKENEQLQEEAMYSQHEIGEVLISARRQANRTVEKAKLDAQRIVKESEAELQTIHDRAKEISCEVDESRQTILSIYEELKTRVDQLAQNDEPDLDELKERYEYPKVSVLARKDYK